MAYGKTQTPAVDWDTLRKYPMHGQESDTLSKLAERVRGSRNYEDVLAYLAKKLEDARKWNESTTADEYNRAVVNTLKHLIDELTIK